MKKRIFIFVFMLFIFCAVFAGFLQPLSAGQAAAADSSFRIELDFRGNRLLLSDGDFVINTTDHILQARLKKRGTGYAEKAGLAEIAKKQGFAPEQIINYILPLFSKKLDGFARGVEKDPIPAEIYFEPHSAKFTLTREAAGYKIDREDLYRRLLDAFISSPRVKLALKTHPVHSPVTTEVLKKGAFLKSGFSTDFSSSGPERRHNIALAASFWNGVRIEPGAEASFNKIVGPRTAERGFEESNVILNKRFEKGIGGGVCQVSTTIYNAALKAGMEITAAVNHSLPVSYVLPSFDAAVSSAQDMKFRNNTGFPVFIRAYCGNGRLYVQFYGEKNAYTIERRSEKIKVIPYEKDETIVDVKGEYLDKVRYRGEKARIREARDGLVSKGYLRYFKNGKLVKEILLRTDSYAPQDGLTVEGNLPPPPPPPPQEPVPSVQFPPYAF